MLLDLLHHHQKFSCGPIAADRLMNLSGLAGVSAAAMLLAIGQCGTADDALVEYSGLDPATAAEHLLTDVAVPAAVFGSGGPDANARGKPGRTETEEDLEHIERKAEHGRRIYGKDEPVQAKPIPPSVPRNAELEPARETPALFSSEPAPISVDVQAVAQSIEDAQVVLDELLTKVRRTKDEEDLLVILLAA